MNLWEISGPMDRAVFFVAVMVATAGLANGIALIIKRLRRR